MVHPGRIRLLTSKITGTESGTFVSCGKGPGLQDPDNKLLLFVDVTQSLTATQSGATLLLAKSLLHTERDYQNVAVYPIGTGGEAPVPFLDEKVDDSVSGRNRQLKKWDAILDTKAHSLNGKHGTEQTCMLNSVEFASKQLQTASSSDTSMTNIVFITDMIEDCASTPFSHRIGLQKTSIQQEIQEARMFPQDKITLPKAEVFIVVPAGQESGPHAPRIDDLEQFWKALFARCSGARVAAPKLTIARSTLPGRLMKN